MSTHTHQPPRGLTGPADTCPPCHPSDAPDLASDPSAPSAAGERKRRPRAWAERSVEQSIESFRASFKRMGVPETDVKVTWDTDALWARVRFVVPGTDPRRIVEHVIRYDETKHPRKSVGDVLWTLARWLDERSRRIARGVEWGVVFFGEEPRP